MATILVVEDEAHPRLMYVEYLRDFGYDVLEADSGRAAIEMVAGHPVDVVVLDIAMPGMDGVEVLSKILDVKNQLPVILNTAYGSYKDDFMTWAAEAYVTKSANLGELRKQIETALQKRGVPVPSVPPQG